MPADGQHDSASRGRTGTLSESAWLLTAIALFVLQQIAIRTFALDGAPGVARRAIFLVTTALLMLIALRYRRYFGAWLIAAGIALNLIPMIFHGGLMPVSYEVVHDSGAFPEITREDIGRQLSSGKDIVLNADDITFPWLADRYTVTLPGYGTNIYSLGDFVLFGGIGFVILQLVGTGIWAIARPDAPDGNPDGPASSRS
ncbi:DUF5317 domain-containing protein [bacterium]|nr:DUF5317 domain-containing protein [bacterium]